jgi:hypothetical protein
MVTGMPLTRNSRTLPFNTVRHPPMAPVDDLPGHYSMPGCSVLPAIALFPFARSHRVPTV